MFAAYVGWTTVDVLLHGPVVALDPNSRRRHTYNAVHANDLFSWDTLPAYVQRARASAQFSESEKQFVQVTEWLNSSDYYDRLIRTPPWPCGECMGLDARTSCMPPRPKRLPKTKRELNGNPEWLEFRDAKSRLIKIAERSVKQYETQIYGSEPQMRKLRKVRRAGNKVREQELSENRMKDDIRQRRRRGKTPTKRQREYLRRERKKAQIGVEANPKRPATRV
jgi:hypothetical protein